MKIYFLASEIAPFSQSSFLASFCRSVPIRLQQHDHDIRLTSPKYGFISERKFTLREVIRLREIPSEINGETTLASAKSAFIPKTRVQVYFMEHSEWFQPLTTLLYKAKNGRPLPDNDDRFAFYSKIALEMLVNLFWAPDVIVCNDWQSSWVPLLYKQLFADQDFYKGIKTVQIIHSIDDYSKVSEDSFKKVGTELPKNFDGGELNSLAVAADCADLVIVVDGPDNKTSKELSTNGDFKPHIAGIKKQLKTGTLQNEDDASCGAIADVINEILIESFGSN
ncbi:MAG: glycogen/starch synthase [Candidatus Neomarinimicrobiota bacterium]|nr:glycogen/starch synthase [Candidatus Neomarinimicrobiota bacterium]